MTRKIKVTSYVKEFGREKVELLRPTVRFDAKSTPCCIQLPLLNKATLQRKSLFQSFTVASFWNQHLREFIYMCHTRFNATCSLCICYVTLRYSCSLDCPDSGDSLAFVSQNCNIRYTYVIRNRYITLVAIKICDVAMLQICSF